MLARTFNLWKSLAAVLACCLGMAGASASADAGQERPYERWSDPRENAFSLEVPKGWKVTGGTRRPSPLRVTTGVYVTSPDGRTQVTATDDLPVYVVPNQGLAMVGIGEGGWYTDGFGLRHPVRSYAPGAKWITHFLLPSLPHRVKMLSVKDHAELSKQLSQCFGVAVRYDAGEVAYEYERDGVIYKGKAYCITQLINSDVHAMWHVFRLTVVEAPADKLAEAEAVLVRMGATTQINLQWAQAQMRMTAEQVRILNNANTAIFNTITQGYWENARRMDTVFDRGSRARRGVDDFYDPVLGQVHYGVENRHNYYWINDRGDIRGTDTYDPPSQYYRPLHRLP